MKMGTSLRQSGRSLGLHSHTSDIGHRQDGGDGDRGGGLGDGGPEFGGRF